MTREQMKDSLELLVDATSLPHIVEMLSEICSEKADHVRESYADEALASSWEADSKALLAMAASLPE